MQRMLRRRAGGIKAGQKPLTAKSAEEEREFAEKINVE